MPKVAKHISFSGQVQGVGFRFTAQRIAMRYDICGHIRNTFDGKVEVLAQGDSEDINDFVQDLRDAFTVRDVSVGDVPVDSQYDGFNILL